MVPATKVGHQFQDLQSLVNQRIAARADRVLIMVAGIPMQIKPPSRGIPTFQRTQNEGEIRMKWMSIIGKGKGLLMLVGAIAWRRGTAVSAGR